MSKVHQPIGILAALIGAPAVAQVAPAPPPAAETQIPDIIVTAQRTATNLQNTPVAVTALTGQALAERGAISLLDVQNFTPNLTIATRSDAGPSRGGFTIRGIGVDASTGSAAVGIYIDEVYYPSASANLLGLFDVNRVEVLRGPQGTLFGRNTIAGAVQYITNKPTHDLGGFATLTYGNLDRLEAGGALNLPITDTLAIRLSGRYNRTGGYIRDDLNGVDRGREVTKQGRAQLHWTPTSGLTIDLKGEVLDLKNNGRPLTVLDYNRIPPNPINPFIPNGSASLVDLATQFGFNPEQLATLNTSTRRYHSPGFNGRDDLDYVYRDGQMTIAYEVSDQLTLKSVSAYSFSREHQFFDLDATPLPILDASPGLITTRLFTQEIQAAGKLFDDRLSYTVGGYYYRSNAKTRYLDIYPGLSPVALPGAGGDYKSITDAKAIYGQLTYKLTDRLSAMAGLRYSNERATGELLNTTAPAPGHTVPVAPAAFGPYHRTFNDLSPSFGLNFQVTPDTLIYAKASRGFRAGGVVVNGNLTNPAPPARPITATPGYLPFDQESAWTYELGTRLQSLNHRVRFNPTIFYTDWNNIQFNTFVFNPSPQIVTQNAGKARIYGLELESNVVISRSFTLDGSFSYLHGEYTAVLPGAPVMLNSSLQHAPKFKFSVGARYVIPLHADNEIALNANYSWTDRQRSATSDVDAIELPSYGLLNARVEYAMKKVGLALSLFGTNITNKYYYIGGNDGLTTTGVIEADIGRPREYGISVRLNF